MNGGRYIPTVHHCYISHLGHYKMAITYLLILRIATLTPLPFLYYNCSIHFLQDYQMDSNFDINLLTSEIFSILENKFLFQDYGKDLNKKFDSNSRGKVRILSIDGHGATNGILAAKSLSHLEACLGLKHGDPDARIADFFDVAAGSGVGGILAALLFTKGKDGRPIFTADEALNLLVNNRKKFISSSSSSNGIFRRLSRPTKAGEKILSQTLGESTLKDTLKPVLIPCYDLSTHASFLFSRADALEIDSFDFTLKDVCMATCGVKKSFEMRSVDKSTKIVAVDGGVAMNNPTTAAITHVLNNKQEFPFCDSVQDLLVVSLGNGESDSSSDQIQEMSPSGFLNIAREGVSDMVDQAVSLSFGEFRTTNYVRIQASGCSISSSNSDKVKLVATAEEMLKQNNVESVMFQGKKMGKRSNLDKLELFAGELIKENERRKTSIFPTVLFKQVSPRTSSSTLSTISSSY